MGNLRYLTAGESHGPGLTVIIEGVPAGLCLSEEYLVRDLSRRQKGYGRGGRMKIEKDRAKIFGGIRHGATLGSPISLWIQNKDWENWTEVMSIEAIEEEAKRVTRLRPGHADMPGVLKYNQRDVRNILERASARETAARVAVGGVCRRFLEEFDIGIHSSTVSIGPHAARQCESIDWEKVEASPVRCADPEAEQKMIAAIDAAKEAGGHGRGSISGNRQRRSGGSGESRSLGPEAGRADSPGDDEHQRHERRRDWSRLRVNYSFRLAGPRRYRALRWLQREGVEAGN